MSVLDSLSVQLPCEATEAVLLQQRCHGELRQVCVMVHAHKAAQGCFEKVHMAQVAEECLQ